MSIKLVSVQCLQGLRKQDRVGPNCSRHDRIREGNHRSPKGPNIVLTAVGYQVPAMSFDAGR